MTTKNFNKYTYPSLERVDLEIGRHYLDSKNTPVPSVTTVLSATSKSKDGIAQWRNRVGEAEADRIVKQSTDIGSASPTLFLHCAIPSLDFDVADKTVEK